MPAMARVAVVRHNEEVALGRLGGFLSRHHPVEVWARDADFPEDVDAAVVLGGFMGAYESDLHPWLVDECEWLSSQVERGVPVLGICLGAQLLAHALGGEAYEAPRPEVGVVELRYTDAGREHPVASRLGDRAFFAHQDTFRLPPDAELLASTDRYPAVFQAGSALGVQCHPETPPDDARHWLQYLEADMLPRAGVTPERYLAEVDSHAEAGERSARDFFTAWFGSLDGSDR